MAARFYPPPPDQSRTARPARQKYPAVQIIRCGSYSSLRQPATGRPVAFIQNRQQATHRHKDGAQPYPAHKGFYLQAHTPGTIGQQIGRASCRERAETLGAAAISTETKNKR